MRIGVVLMTAAALLGCATPPPRAGGESDLDRLQRECRERGGLLLPLAGVQTGRVETDNYCDLRGGSVRTRR